MGPAAVRFSVQLFLSEYLVSKQCHNACRRCLLSHAVLLKHAEVASQGIESFKDSSTNPAIYVVVPMKGPAMARPVR